MKQNFSKAGWYCLTLMAALCLSGSLSAQVAPVEVDTSARMQKVQIDHADIRGIRTDTGEVKFLTGTPERGVELRQDSTYMYCDSAVVINDQDVRAFGNVIIQKGDSLTIYSDALIFYSRTQQAILSGAVVLEHVDDQLWTKRLHYDLEQDIAFYDSTAVLINDSTQVSSKIGYYWVNQDIAKFIDSVVVLSENMSLLADSLLYRTEDQVAQFIGPTYIVQDSSEIYCEAGFYDVKNQNAEFRENAEYVNNDQRAWADRIVYTGENALVELKGNAHFEELDRKVAADLIQYFEESGQTLITGNARFQDSTRNVTADRIEYNRTTEVLKTIGRSRLTEADQVIEADTIDYDQLTGLGFARGHVVFQDTAAKTTVIAEFARYNKKTEFVKAYGHRRPLLKSLMDNDTMYLTGDTLVFQTYMDTISQDSFQRFFGYHDVRILRGTMQGLCDSLSFDARDSMFHLLGSPVMWSDTTQFVADTIRLQLRNQKMDRIFLRQNAIIVSIVQQTFFDQIKGRNVDGIFEDDALKSLDVIGNAESIYYAQDDASAFIGVNQIASSEIFFTFADKELERIKFVTKPTGKLVPMEKANHATLRLDGFSWKEELRPKVLEDLF